MKTLFCFVLLSFCAIQANAQDYALRQLEASPRHHEWVTFPSGERSVHAFVAYPEVSTNVPVMLVIHENRGLTDWVRSFADQVAEAGYIAIAIDFLSDFDETIKRTSDFESSDAARGGISRLKPEQVVADLKAAHAYGKGLASSNGKTIVVGFCWGGSQSWRYAMSAENLSAALVFYGTAPAVEDGYKRIATPVYGFYGGNDQRVNATIQASDEALKALGKRFEYKIYEGAGHAYMRSGDDPESNEANKKARDASWVWMKEILKGL